MPRRQFNLKTLFWVTLAVAMFMGGMAMQRQITGYQATQREKELQDVTQQLRAELRNRVNEARELEDHSFALQEKVDSLQKEKQSRGRNK